VTISSRLNFGPSRTQNQGPAVSKQLNTLLQLITLRASCSAVYCNRSCLWVGGWVGGCVCGSITTITRICVHRSSPNSSRLNFGRPAPPGRESAEGRKFLAPPYYSQRAAFASPLSAFFIRRYYRWWLSAEHFVNSMASCKLTLISRRRLCYCPQRWSPFRFKCPPVHPKLSEIKRNSQPRHLVTNYQILPAYRLLLKKMFKTYRLNTRAKIIVLKP